jgi:hypothetical protein
MHSARNLALLVGSMGVLTSQAASAEMVPVKQQAQTAHYRLELKIGPTEKMFTAGQVAKQQPAEGEVMVGGTMSMGMSPMSMDMGDTRHLEVHVYSLDKGAVVTDARVVIAVMNIASKKAQKVSAAKMYGIKEGPSDTHYGDNVSMPPGNYGIKITVNGEKAEFTVAIPPS